MNRPTAGKVLIGSLLAANLIVTGTLLYGEVQPGQSRRELRHAIITTQSELGDLRREMDLADERQQTTRRMARDAVEAMGRDPQTYEPPWDPCLASPAC